MKNFYPLTTPFKKLAQYLALTMLVIIVGNLSVKAQTPAIAYSASKTLGTGAAITPFGPTSSTNVSAVSYLSSDIVPYAPGGTNTVAVDAAGNLFYSVNNTIYMQPAGSSSRTTIATGFSFIQAIVVDASGNLFLADTNTGAIIKITNPSQEDRVSTTFIAGLRNPRDLEFDQQNHLYILEYNGNNDVVRYTISGGAATDKTIIANGISSPSGIAVDRIGDIYITNESNSITSILKIPASTTTFPVSALSLSVIATIMDGNASLAIDNAGNLFVATFDNSTLQRVDAITHNITSITGELMNPEAVTCDVAGNIYIANTNALNILKFTQNGGYGTLGLPVGLLLNGTTGEISGTPTTITAAANYTVIAYNTNGNSTTAVINIQTVSSNVDLSSLTISSGTLSPAFAAATMGYTTNVTNDVTTLHITATGANAAATISINGATATTGTASADVALNVGSNSIQVVVNVPGITTKTYTLAVTRQGALTFSYNTPQKYGITTAITPLAPTNPAGVAAFGYTQAAFYTPGAAAIPGSIAANKNGNVAVIVPGTPTPTTIKRLNADGTVASSITIPGYTPAFITMDAAGNIYALSAGAGATFRKITPNNTVTTLSGTAATPTGMVVDPTNTYIYVSVAANVRRFTIGSTVNTIINDGYTATTGVAMNAAGDLFISEGTSIYKIPVAVLNIGTRVAKSSLTPIVTTAGAVYSGVASGNYGEIFASDLGTAKAVKMIDANNIVTTFSTGVTATKWVASDASGVYMADATKVYRIGQSGGYSISPSLPAGLAINPSTGTISGTPTVAVAAADYTVNAYDGAGSKATNTVNISVADPFLSGLSVAEESLSPVFAKNTDSYTLSTGAPSVNLTATAIAAGSTLTIKGVTATSGVAATVALTVGENSIPIVVTASDGVTAKTYTVTVTRLGDPTLSYAGGPYTFAAGTAIPAITPASSNIAALSHSSSYNLLYEPGINPQGVAADGLGNVYTSIGGIVKIPPGGGTPTTIPHTTDVFTRALTADFEGNIYVGEYQESASVFKISPNGTRTPIASGFIYISSITRDIKGNIYVNSGGTLKKIAAGSNLVSTVSTDFNNLGPVAADVAGNIYAYSTEVASAIFKISATATYPVTRAQMTTFGTGLDGIVGMDVDNLGNIFTVSQGSSKAVLKITPANVITTIGTLPTPNFSLVIDAYGNINVMNQSGTKGVFQFKIKGGYYVSPELPAGLAIDQTGTITGTPTTGAVATDYKVYGYTYTDKYALATVNIKTTSNTATLSALTLNNGLVSPGFESGTTDYTAMVTAATSAINVKPTATDVTATITVNGTPVTTLAPAVSVNTPFGNTPITVVVTGSDGTTTKTYTLTVSKIAAPVLSYAAGIKLYNTGAPVTLSPASSNVAAYGTTGYGNVKTFSTGVPLPQGLAIDDFAHNIYATDITHGYVYKVNMAGEAETVGGSMFQQPNNVVVDAAGNYYVADGFSVYKNGTVFGSFNTPSVLAIDNAGNIFVGYGTASFTIAKVPFGTSTPVAYATGFLGITSMATDAAGNLYVIDYILQTLTRISTTGVKTVLATGLVEPFGVTVDGTGNIYFTASGKVLMIPAGTTTFPATPTVALTGYQYLMSIAVDKNNKMYIANKDNVTPQIQTLEPNGGYYISPALPAGLVFNNSTGIISGTPTKGSSLTSYIISAYNSASDKAVDTVKIQTISNDANLSALTLSAGVLSPTFSSAVLTYSATITDASITITPTASDPSGAITVNGLAATSGAASANIALTMGDNTIPVVVSANDGTTIKTYTLNIRRVPALTALTTSAGGVLTPAFTSNTFTYAKPVAYTTTSVTITPTAAQGTITINGTPATSGAASATVPLTVGDHSFAIVVTAVDGVTTSTYNLTVTRLPPVLSNLTTNGSGSLAPAFSSTVFNYTKNVSSSTSTIRFTPTTNDGSTITINGASAISGSQTGTLALGIGPNPFNIIVKATDNTTSTYAVIINRLKAQTVTIPTIASAQSTGGPDVDLLATSSVIALPITYSSGNTNRATIVNGKVHFLGTGSVTITATQVGNNEYEAATANKVFTVSKGTAVITLDSTTVTFGGANFTPAVSTNTGTAITYGNISDTNVISRTSDSTALVIVGAGTATVTASQVGTGNYNAPTSKTQTIVVLKSPATAPIDFPALTAVNYKVADFAPGATSTLPGAISYTSSDTTVAKIVDGKIHVVYSGTATITALQVAEDANHLPAKATRVLTVNPVPVLLSSLISTPGLVTKINEITYAIEVTGLTIEKIKLTPTTIDPAAAIAVNGATVPSGTASGDITLNAVGTPTIATVVIQDPAGGISQDIKVIVSRKASSNADLASLTVSQGSLTQVSPTEYNVVVKGFAIVRLFQKAYTADPAATFTVNDIPVESGRSSGYIMLKGGDTTTVITTVVTAEDGTTKKTYTVNITRIPANNANLALLDVNEGKLTKVDAEHYTLVVTGASTDKIKLLIRSDDPAATIKVGTTPVVRNVGTYFPLEETGPTVLSTEITAEDGTTKKVYTLTVTKAPATNANLALLDVNEGKLTQVDAEHYTLLVNGLSADKIKLLIRSEDPAATIKVGTTPMIRNVGTYFSLNPGNMPTVLSTEITAEDGTTKKVYTLTVTKAPATNANLALLDVNEGKLTRVDAEHYTLLVNGLSADKIKLLIRSEDPAATIKVGTTPMIRNVGTYFSLNPGNMPTVLSTEITAEDGTTKKVYTLTVTKAPATNANLALLDVNEGKLTRVDAEHYTLLVNGLSADKIKLLIRSEDPAATIKVGTIPMIRNVGTYFSLNPGNMPTVLSTEITAEDGTTKKVYTLTITKAPATNANLALLDVNEGKLTRVDAQNYTVDLSNAATVRIKLLVRSDDPAATAMVGTTPVARNVGNYFPLNVSGATQLTVVIRAEDNVTEKTYNVTVNKSAPAMRLATNSLAAITTGFEAAATVLTPHQALSPNGDGIGDYFEIEGITAYPDNTVTIINRSGVKVYEAKGYDNRSKVFDGHSSLNGAMQPEGTYFFLIDYTTKGQQIRKTGYLIIKN